MCPKSSELHKNVLLSISLLADVGSERNLSTLFENNIVELLGQSLKYYQDEADVQHWALNAIAHLTTGSESRKSALLSEPCEAGTAILQAMKLHIGDSGVQHAALFAMGNLCSGSPQRKQFFLENGAIASIMSALAAHSLHPGVQGQGILAASNISAGDSEDMIKTASLFLEADFSGLLISAFENHPNDAEVYVGGLAVAAHMCKRSDKWRLQLLSKGLPTLVVKALDSLNHSNIQLWGLAALSNITIDLDRSSVLQADGTNPVDNKELARVVISALQRYPDHAGVIGQGCALIGNFIAVDTEDEFKQRLLDSNIAPCLIKALRNHGDQIEVVKYALFAVGQLVNGDPIACGAFTSDGIVFCIYHSLQQFEEHDMIRHFACSLTYYLLASQQEDDKRQGCISRMKESKGLDVILQRVLARQSDLGKGIGKWVSFALEALS
eukprot:CAMPEP_0114329852 /NCGR_PEP_ID=MMETSP0101-20121206/1343_1 /TAXON_ID=38822 ORGANISM="Pteridomonas danica, Strain PT" /NCGR_SAMPLE_ID=MMETSP0101 /ASSEMBLY_ACC=CAM_ASM_000211 /LENGTH=439 /DNA_ID=CAMNT_0001459633 /DNA_START=220 /DNA_END=1539 /DNA_ORIENTATION=-